MVNIGHNLVAVQWAVAHAILTCSVIGKPNEDHLKETIHEFCDYICKKT